MDVFVLRVRHEDCEMDFVHGSLIAATPLNVVGRMAREIWNFSTESGWLFSVAKNRFLRQRRSGALDFLAGLVALFVASLFAFLVALVVALLLGLLVALGVPFGVATIVSVGRSRRRGRWWCYLRWRRHLIGIGRGIITGSENAARRIVINKGSGIIKGSRKEERIQNYSGSHSTNESGRYKTCGKTGSDENDSVTKTRSDESDFTRKTGSDENTSVGKAGSNDYRSAGKSGPYNNGSAARPGERRTGEGDQCDQERNSDTFHGFLPKTKIRLGCRRLVPLLFLNSSHLFGEGKTARLWKHRGGVQTIDSSGWKHLFAARVTLYFEAGCCSSALPGRLGLRRGSSVSRRQ
jgi:hypothetical protein